MKKLINIVLAAGLTSGAAILPAAAQQGRFEQPAGYAGSVTDAYQGTREQVSPPVREGRNITLQGQSTIGVEPYIARSIEQNARSR